ncbi:flagellar hook protein FlgE [Thermotoga sp. KOL6]|uniref:flagellar hook protein FlgE n=1 Tax=Thermotoga sp. KOL6 TaxID=126741 RepID=UPI000C77612D|nr:flagellar hook-basal body complex protein [Thermotoga sp. KOL6]PLV59524.1 flagellar hook-basal body protein [Thermotoga sp. KOL6]
MMRSLYSGITGLKNFQVAMDVVGNNISNVNTVGFKASRVNFETMLAQTIKAGRAPQANVGGTNPMQIGLGSQVASIDKIMTQGSFQNTGVKTDLAIQGDGFFIVSDGSAYYYTRAGAFTLDSNGNLIQTSTGYKVQGWTAVQDPETGERYIDTNKPIGDLVISAGMTMPAKKTSNVRFEGNLNSHVGPGPFTITLTDNNGIDHDVRVWFERTANDLGTDPFSSSQRYTISIDTDNDGIADQFGYMVFNEFGRVEEAGLYNNNLETQTITATTDGSLSGTTSLPDGSYWTIVLDPSGQRIYKGSVTVSGGSFTITDPDISSGNDYTVVFYDSSNTTNSLTIADGAELVIPTSGEPRFYEADNPTNFVQVEFTSPRYTTAVQVYDSLGNAYTVYYEFVRLGSTTIGDESFKNAWIWRAYTASGEPVKLLDENGASGVGGNDYISGLIEFDESGRPVQYRGLYYDSGSSSYALGSSELRTIQFDTGLSGDGVVTITADLSGITQFSGDSTVNIPWQDGNPMGVLESFAINEQGEIIGTFSNGLTDVLGQIALAVFNNPAGLMEVGNSLYSMSSNSGVPKIGAPGSGGRGTLIPGALEMSNVDLAEEFTKMIIAQRGFQANARVITTADQILNELVNIKR